jgi:DNA primase catalytic subunit
MTSMDNLPATRPTNHRIGKRGRPSQLDDPEFCASVALAFASGATRDVMCQTFGVRDPMTITRWRKDPRIKPLLSKLIEERVQEMQRKVDAALQAKLAKADELSVKDLIDIRKEIRSSALGQKLDKADADDVNEMQAWLESNPEAHAALDEFLQNGSS